MRLIIINKNGWYSWTQDDKVLGRKGKSLNQKLKSLIVVTLKRQAADNKEVGLRTATFINNVAGYLISPLSPRIKCLNKKLKLCQKT